MGAISLSLSRISMKWGKKIHRVSLSFPSEVLQVIKKIHAEGAEAYITGGALRDALLGKSSSDVDVATSLQFHKLQQIFPEDQVMIALPKYFCVKLRCSQIHVDVTSYRSESSYDDHRRPSSVVPATQVEDASRRDLTMNALYYDPTSEQLVDYFGGLSDLLKRAQVKLIRGKESLEEDYLRIVRCARFALQCGLKIEPTTLQDIQRTCFHIWDIEPERFRQEISKCLQVASLGDVLRTFEWCGILALFGVMPFSKGSLAHRLLTKIQILSVGECDHRDFLFMISLLSKEKIFKYSLAPILRMMPISKKEQRQIYKAYTQWHHPEQYISNFHPPAVFQALMR